jgi:UDP-glucose 4-epimerase
MLLYLVTGGAGFIGSHIVDALLERGSQVRVLDNLSTGNLKNLSHVADRIEFIEGDVREAQAVAKAVRKVDCVFHQAALPSVPRSVENPLDTHHACITGTLNVLNESRLAGVQRVVYAGSSSAYGNLEFSSKRETDRPGPLSPYAVAKLSGEYYCHAFHQTYGLQTVAIRYFNVFGPRQDPNSAYSAVIPLFIAALLKGQRPVIYGDGLQSRDFTFVKNVVHGNLLASQAQGVGGRVFNVAGGRSFSLLDLLAKLNNYLGTSIDPIHKDPRTGDVKHSLADITQASQALSYEPVVDLDTGLQLSIDYYRTLLS